MRLFLFDDLTADAWDPFALTRPCSELLFGTQLLRARLERFAGTRTAGLISRSWLQAYREENTPPVVVDTVTINSQDDRLFLCARYVPTPGVRFESPREPTTLLAAGQVVGVWLPADAPTPSSRWFQEPSTLPAAPEMPLAGLVLEAAWHLITENPEQLRQDLESEIGASKAPRSAETLPRGVEQIGPGPVLLGADVCLEPGVLLDTRAGPVRLDSGVEVRAGSRLAGPLHIGAGSRVLGGLISSVSAGPCSRLQGEIEASVLWGFANKAHAGYLGHAYVGRWVNLGALTTNSDLKNNYGTVRVGPAGAEKDTGLLKLGCLLGDHVKTGIGMLLNTGTIVGAGSNLFGDMPPKWVAPFSWGDGDALEEHRKEAFLRTASVVLGRRDIAFDETTRAWLGAVWEAGRSPGELSPQTAGSPSE